MRRSARPRAASPTLRSPSDTGILTVTFLTMASGRTLFRFHQARFQTVEGRNDHIAGWSSLFDKLATYLETAQ